MRFALATALFFALVHASQWYWQSPRCMGAFRRSLVCDGPGGEYGLHENRVIPAGMFPEWQIPRINRTWVVLGPVGSIPANRIVGVSAGAALAGFVLCASAGNRKHD